MATVDLGLLQWPQRLDAVRSEVEILDGIPASLDPDKPSSDAIYRNGHVYGSAILLPMGELKGKKRSRSCITGCGPTIWTAIRWDLTSSCSP